MASKAKVSIVLLGVFIVNTFCSGAFAVDEKSKKYAFLVAVQSYSSTELSSLFFSNNDILKFAQILKKSGYEEQNIVVLSQTVSDSQFLPTAFNIETQLQTLLSQLNKGDMLTVAFSGHGVQFKDEKFPHFCPSDAKLADRATLVSFEVVYRAIETCRAQTKLLFVDACRNQPNFAKGFVETELEPAGRRPSIPPGGISALFSCSQDQLSFEHPDLQHGVFFNFLIQGLEGNADIDDDGRISLSELDHYTVSNVGQFAKERLLRSQTPERWGEVRGQIIVADLAGNFDNHRTLEIKQRLVLEATSCSRQVEEISCKTLSGCLWSHRTQKCFLNPGDECPKYPDEVWCNVTRGCTWDGLECTYARPPVVN